MKKKLIALMLTAVMGVSLVACSGDSEETSSESDDNAAEETSEGDDATGEPGVNAEVKSDETIVIALPAEPETLLSIASVTTIDAYNIMGYLCDRLVDYDAEADEIVPMLATEWEYTDATHISFVLRDDVVAVDGTPLTADDVYYTFATASELVPTQDIGLYIDMDETEAIDDTHFTLGLTEPLPDFPFDLAEASYSIVSESAVEAVGGIDVANTQNPNVGSGKYLLDEWAQGEYMLLERNEDYWDKDWIGYYQYVKFVFINDSAARIMAVESGDAQIGSEVPQNQAAPLEGNDGIDIVNYNDGTVAQIYFNCTSGVSGIFNDKAVRQAATMAIDKNAINQVLTAGQTELEQGIIPSENEYYVQVVDDLDPEVDIEGAKQILEDAGYTGTLEARAICLQAYLDVLTIAQENLRQIGIELEVEALDTAQYVTEARAGEYDIQYGTQTQKVRNAGLFCIYDTQQYEDLISGPRYGNEALDEQILIAKTSTDKEETAAAFEYILTEIMEEYTCVGISRLDKACIVDDSLEGLNFWIRGLVDVTNAYPAD